MEQTSGRQQLNIHGAIDLETGKTRMIEAATVNAISTIMLMPAIEAMYRDHRETGGQAATAVGGNESLAG